MFSLPKLPYAYDALEPYIDEETMRIHHTKHHQGYVDKLNAALEGRAELVGKSIEELLAGVEDIDEDIRQAVINNGGGHANHSLFWQVMNANPKHETRNPKGELVKAINKTFGSFEKFKEEFSGKALSLFGSGWVFLQADESGNLSLKRHSFQNSPLMHGRAPILGLDVWEHAYYLKYQNRRNEYVEAFWNVVNWEKVERNFEQALG